MLIKVIVVGLIAVMIYNLFRALIIMNKNDPGQVPMSKYIGRRVITSVVIILLLLLGILTGLITPNPRPY
ncbi:Protein of unknown function [Colwellia chukchiensis]|uniref:DUF2909 domain-containing protein n=1 Tax=Colwellia chukchiensis TaxID=641665 RepID=A0A1H7Q289_9GAMM|nr:DUF2909 domain-containing protein [Colwellia chukchiensis]SEL41595.1 Protein of unknown function [Colwellia chukchiensis]